MRIAFVSTHLPSTYVGGAEILTELIAGELVRQGHDVTVYTGSIPSANMVRGVAVRMVPLLRPKPWRSFMSPFNGMLLRRSLSADRFFMNAHVVHAMDVDSLSLLAWWGEIQPRLVATIQDYGAVCPAGDLLDGVGQCPNYCHMGQGFLCMKHRRIPFPSNIRTQLAFSVRKTMRDGILARVRYAICVSNFVSRELLRFAPHIRVEVIGNCVSPDWFSESRTGKDIDVLFVGRLEWYKGVDVLISALRDVPAKRAVSAVFIGRGDTGRYAQAISRAGLARRVKLLGEVPNAGIRQYYRRAKVVAVPSIWPEPCGRTIIEGMASGCAVIATHTGGTPEQLTHMKHGILVPPANRTALKRAILYFLSDGSARTRMGVSARNFARRAYSLESVAKRYAGFYSLIGSQAGII